MSVRVDFAVTNFYGRIGVDDCNNEQGVCLPIYDKSDVQFQFLITCTTTGEDTAIRNGATNTAGPQIKFTLGAYTTCEDFAGITRPPDRHATLNIYPLGSPGSKRFLATVDTWTTDQIATYEAGQCIYLNVIMEDAQTEISEFTVKACSGCFTKIADPCFTSVIKYRNAEDAFYMLYNTDGFNAVTEEFYNTVRLPFYLYGLQLPTEEKSYTKSDGSKIKLYARMDREYSAKVDFLRKEYHTMLNVALNHDTLLITSINENGIDDSEFVLSDKYEMQWTDMPKYPLAQATFKVRQADAVQLTNNSCN